MGFPIRQAFVRTTLIGVMLGGGLVFAGIAQAQDANVSGERGAELVAAVGGPAPTAHLLAYRSDKAAVEIREADVAGSPSEAEGQGAHAVAAPAVMTAAVTPARP